MYHLYLIWVSFLQPHPLVQFSNNLVLGFERLFSARYHIPSDQWGEYWKEKVTDNSLANRGTSSGLSTIPSCTRALCRDANLKMTPEMSISTIDENDLHTALLEKAEVVTYDVFGLVAIVLGVEVSHPVNAYLSLDVFVVLSTQFQMFSEYILRERPENDMPWVFSWFSPLQFDLGGGPHHYDDYI